MGITSFTATDILCVAARDELANLIWKFRKDCATLLRKGRKRGVRIKFKSPLMGDFLVTIEPRKKP